MRRRVILSWIVGAILFLVLPFAIDRGQIQVDWFKILLTELLIQGLIAGFFLLMLHAQNRASDMSPQGTGFRTGGVPMWRLVLYAMIATGGAVASSYPALRPDQNMFVYWSTVILIPAGMVFFFGALPRMKSWSMDHPRLARGVVLALMTAGVISGIISAWLRVSK